MLQEERLQRIEELLKQKKFCSINDLAIDFVISKATVRRDLKILEERHKLRITRGGATIVGSGTAQEPPYGVKKSTNYDEKIRIGKKARDYINNGETVIIDTGTTTLQVAASIGQIKNITIATNDLMVACQLANNIDIDLTIIGGMVRKNYFTTIGYLAQYALEHINADKAFLGVDAIDLKKGCMITNMDEIAEKKMILKAAKSKIVVCDHSKFEGVAFMDFCSLKEIDMIITGRELDEKIYASFIEAGINLVLA